MTGLPAAADVVVVGAGLAGCAAAIEAAAAGAEVMLLEKQAAPGGSSKMSSGFFAFAGTPEQAAQGIADSPACFLEDLLRVGDGANDPALLARFMEHQLDGRDWLRSRGVAFDTVRATSGQSVPRTHPVDSRDLFRRLEAEIAGQPRIRLVCGVGAERLLRDGERVGGLRMRAASGAVREIAVRGVVLTSGGFSHSEELLRTFAPLQARAVRLGGAGNTGDGLRMALALGAGLKDMGFIRGTFGCHPSGRETQDPDCVRMPVSVGGIAVNRAGVRFVNESLTYKELGDACLREDGAMAFQIFDAAMLAQGSGGHGPLGLRTGLEHGWIVEAPTLAALAERLGLDGAVLAATVDEYNRGVALGVDRLGRRTLVAGFGALAPIKVGPFYGFACTSSVLATYCGLAVDAQTRVLEVFGGVIPGLYAAGEISGGFHGASNMAGTALAKALVFGRLAAREVSK